MTYEWDDLPEWQKNYLRHLALNGWYYGQDGPKAWCHMPVRPPDDLPGSRAAYVPSIPRRLSGYRRPTFDFEARPLVPDHTVPRFILPALARAVPPSRWRRWTRRHLWFLTRDGRQTRELRRLLARIDRQARERDQ